MQSASNEYKSSMKKPFRNRGYIKATIGVFNHDAQDSIYCNDNQAWWSNPTKVFNGYKVTKQYATREKNFSVLDGSMYFLPEEDSGLEIYNGGLISNTVNQSIKLNFNSETSFDIKGFTINFGTNYPTKLKLVINDSSTTTYTYDNDSSVFSTEDVFDNVTQIEVVPVTMLYENGRLRILEFYCGIVNSFTSKEISNYSWKEYVSSISDSIPSQDMSLTVINNNGYYSPNNPDSTLAYMELGQEISVQFGYDIDGKGNIEWIKPVNAYLKTWSADEKQAKFTATDIFDYQLNGTYNKGKYYSSGISLYDLALDVFTDAGITDSRDYSIDSYLKDIKVYNPLPSCSHAEALQIIANAGRCALSITRDNQICLQSNFVPNANITSNNLDTRYGSLNDLISDSAKHDYAIRSKGYNTLDNTLYFYNGDVTKSGFVSSSHYENGAWVGDTPEIAIEFEAAWSFYGMSINFKNVYPSEIKVYSYNSGTVISSKTYAVNGVNWVTDDEFKNVDKIIIEFTKGSEKSRLYVDSISVSNITTYTLHRSGDIIGTVSAERNSKIKNIAITKTNYRTSTEVKNISSDTIVVPGSSTQNITIDLSNASYGYTVEVDSGSGVVVDSSAYYCTIKLSNNTASDISIKYTIKGYEYITDTSTYKVNHNNSGEDIVWNNPLISNDDLASKIEDWLSDYYLGAVNYSIPWRGDPRVDANDLFYVENVNKSKDLIRVYQNELNFNGAWSGTMKGRVADLTWQ